MKISEYIEDLQDLMRTYGDLECVDSYDNPPDPPEYCEGVIVLYEGEE